MAKVYLDEIDTFLASNTFDVLTNDSNNSKNINSSIDTFVNGSKDQLVGVNWDGYRSKMGQYNEAFNSGMQIASKMGDAIKEALQLLKDYLGDDLMLDSSKLEYYQKQKSICENSIETLRGMLTQTTTVEGKDANGNPVYTTQLLYDTGEINSKISLAQETLTELNRLITKIEGLDEVYNKAEAILQDAFSGIDSFGASVTSITPDGRFEYKHVY